MEFKDYYATLGVPKSASGKDIKQAFRKLARKHHPDVNPGDKAAEARFKELNEAYEVLGDPEKRRKYDELGANWRMYEQAGAAGGSPFGGSPGGGWNVHVEGGGPGGFRTMTAEQMREMFGDEDPFSDFFHTFFGGRVDPADAARRGRGARARASRQGRDVESEITLTLEDAFQGSTHQLSLRSDGQARTIPVRIPAGVGEGSRVRIAGEGEHGTGGAQSGDLYLRIRLAPHGRFERKGRDLYVPVPVPLTTAVLGGEVEVPTLGGRSLRLRVPPTTQNGQVFRLKGHGMPAVGKPGETGDLYATVGVELPRELTPEERSHFEALKRLQDRNTNSAA
jgi:DnaJ-class molecular chaperone